MTERSETAEPEAVLRVAEPGPYDLIGDVHGCHEELVLLLTQLGHHVGGTPQAPTFTAAEGRRVVFVGDLVDRGPANPAVLRLAMEMVRGGGGLCVKGNHDHKLARKLAGRDVTIAFGLAESLEQLEAEPPEFLEEVRAFLHGLPYQILLDDERLVVSHAGLRASLHGVDSKRSRALCLFGETTGEKDERGYPVRKDWAAEYSGEASVVYGHTPIEDALWRNGTMNLDTGCVFGGALTALRYPEGEVVRVDAVRVHYVGM